MEGLHTWSTELTHGGCSGPVVDTAETATFRHTPGRCAGPIVSLLGCIIDLHVGRALRQVFAVMAQAILSNLDGVEVALRAPLSGQRHTWVERGGLRRQIRTVMLHKYRKCPPYMQETINIAFVRWLSFSDCCVLLCTFILSVLKCF